MGSYPVRTQRLRPRFVRKMTCLATSPLAAVPRRWQPVAYGVNNERPTPHQRPGLTSDGAAVPAGLARQLSELARNLQAQPDVARFHPGHRLSSPDRNSAVGKLRCATGVISSCAGGVPPPPRSRQAPRPSVPGEASAGLVFDDPVSKKFFSFFRSTISLIQGNGFSVGVCSGGRPIWVQRRLVMNWMYCSHWLR